ncbi:MAG: alpha-amylase [Clostridia bacterium]|nr:alpha-amylase [Clostridia bacterium]
MKLKRTFFAGLALSLAFALTCPLAGCNRGNSPSNPSDDELNVIDDNNRNWYEIFVRSFCDSGDDGVGDLKGVTMKLDYLAEMGYNGIWLMPICESTTYHGYDVSDYYTVEKDYGTNDDFKELVREAHARGINVIIDMVINHTSSSNEWFRKATTALKNGETTGENAKYIEYYNFSQSSQTGYNQVNGANWYYESRFDKIMPDLNLDSSVVREEIKSIFEFWLKDMDCDGFRLDAVTSYYTGNVQKNVEFLEFVNDTAKSIKEDAYIVGEAWEGTDQQIRDYYESGCDSFFLFTMSAGAGSSSTVKQLFSPLLSTPGQKLESLLLGLQTTYDKGSLAPFLGNHDTARAANMLASEALIKMGAGVMSIMNGNVFVYYGDEIGMICADTGNDPSKRIPMRWSDNDMAEGQVFNYKPQGYNGVINKSLYPNGSVESQKDDPHSIYNYYKAAMRLRNRHPEIARGTIDRAESVSPYVAAMKKTWNGESIYILVNLSDAESFEISLSAYGGVKVADTLNAIGASTVSGGKLLLQPYSIAVLR